MILVSSILESSSNYTYRNAILCLCLTFCAVYRFPVPQRINRTSDLISLGGPEVSIVTLHAVSPSSIPCRCNNFFLTSISEEYSLVGLDLICNDTKFL